MSVRPLLNDPPPRHPSSPRTATAPHVLVIGASTGGPQALVALIGSLSSVVERLPTCVTLHMPRDLMPVIATHVARRCNVATHVVDTPCVLDTGRVYFAPGDRHLALRRSGARCDLTLLPSPTIDCCQSAVDVMFESAGRAFGSRTLAIVLSGMGKDGLAGSRAVAAAGGSILVQDSASSAVWGMPGAVAKAELAAAILSPDDLAREVKRRMSRAVITR